MVQRAEAGPWSDTTWVRAPETMQKPCPCHSNIQVDKKLVGQLVCGIQNGRNKTTSPRRRQEPIPERFPLTSTHAPQHVCTTKHYEGWLNYLLMKGQECHRYCVISGKVTIYRRLGYLSLALDSLFQWKVPSVEFNGVWSWHLFWRPLTIEARTELLHRVSEDYIWAW